MLVLAITGGIAMGKSTVVGALGEFLDAPPVFDADACVRELLTRREICDKIAGEFGLSALDPDGRVNRPYLRDQVFDNADRRAALEGILHPEVRKEYVAARDRASADARPLFVADIPLLFESGRRDYRSDLILVVACDRESQEQRLLQRPGIDTDTAGAMIAAQLPIENKVSRADHVIWNAGSKKQLLNQTNYFARWLTKKKI